MKRTLAVGIVRVGALCLVLLGTMGGAALPQKIESGNPRAAAAERAPAGGCRPIGLTGSGETVFPYRCKEFIERQKAANQKTSAEENQKPAATTAQPDTTGLKTADVNSVTAERKPAAAEEKPAAVKESTAAKQQESVVPEKSTPAPETVGTIPLPKRVEREARGRTIGPPGCMHFRSYDPASGTYRALDRQRRPCRELISTTIAAKAGPPAARVPLPPDSSKAPPQSEGSAAAVDSNATTATIAASHSTADDASSKTRTIEAQVAAATMVAEHLTLAAAAPPPDMKANGTDEPGRAETPVRGNAEKTASASANDVDILVAVVMAGPDITSVSDLTGKTIAIDDKYSASIGSVRTAIVAAGAPDIQLSVGQTAAITRLLNGGVPAAILALVSADAAEGFPVIAGFKILDLPLSPRSLKARP